MATSVHIPKELLVAVDRKARRLKISRNRLIVKALEREIADADWPPDFFSRLQGLPPDAAGELAASLDEVRARRRSKSPVEL